MNSKDNSDNGDRHSWKDWMTGKFGSTVNIDSSVFPDLDEEIPKEKQPITKEKPLSEKLAEAERELDRILKDKKSKKHD